MIIFILCVSRHTFELFFTVPVNQGKRVSICIVSSEALRTALNRSSLHVCSDGSQPALVAHTGQPYLQRESTLVVPKSPPKTPDPQIPHPLKPGSF